MIFQWFKPHRSHYFSPRFVGPKKGHWDFLTFRNILWRDVTRGCSHLALGWYSQAGVGSAKVTKEESLFFFQHHNWKYLRIWDIWDDIVISICLFIWFARILERCLRFLGMAQWWKDKKFKQYMKGPCFFLEPILLQHVALGQAGSLARISILSENVRRRCSFSGALTGQETDPHGPQVINRFRLIVAISGEVLARFLKSSVLEHFGLFGEREPHTTWAESCVFVVRFRVFFSWM